MVDVGDTAPDFTAPLANGDIEEFTLSERLAEEAPIVLAFFPGAFTSVCSHEMGTFEDRLEEFADAGASVYGISIDSPFSLNEFREDLALSFGLLSDHEKTVIDEYDVRSNFDDLGIYNVAQRSVFIVDQTQTVIYAWRSDNPGIEPDYDAVLDAV
jgi:peroxiredoxin